MLCGVVCSKGEECIDDFECFLCYEMIERVVFEFC